MRRIDTTTMTGRVRYVLALDPALAGSAEACLAAVIRNFYYDPDTVDRRPGLKAVKAAMRGVLRGQGALPLKAEMPTPWYSQ